MCEIYEEYNAKRGFGVRESIDFYVVFALRVYVFSGSLSKRHFGGSVCNFFASTYDFGGPSRVSFQPKNDFDSRIGENKTIIRPGQKNLGT